MTELITGLEDIDVADRLGDRLDNFKEGIENIKDADGALLKAAYAVPAAWHGLRLATGAVTTPFIFALQNIGKVMPIVGKVAVQPIQVPAFLFSKAVSTKSQYNGKVISDFGENLGAIVGGVSQIASKGLNIM